LSTKFDQIREAAEADLETFIKLVAPKRLLGGVHRELILWWNRSEAKKHQLVLLPRDHMKSALVAYRVAWWITKHPDTRVLYISSTANLAEKQLKFIKDILTSKIYRRYWPEMVNEDEGKREKWSATEISVDHPLRTEEAVRDPTVFTGGLTTSLTGLHCDVAVLDDVVVYENAYTEEGRKKVHSQYSLLSSIEGADALEWVVGTRYHPKDLYNDLMEMEEEVYDDNGDIIETTPVYEKFERQVEDQGDGTGEFLWPRQQRSDGKWFGFDRAILARKRAKYLDRTQYRAQYYNDPNDPEGGGINRDYFQYYDKKSLTRAGGVWYNNGRKLNVYAAIDFAYSLTAKSDYTCLAVIGVDEGFNYYILQLYRFRTESISEYYKYILEGYMTWGFRKLRAEVTAAQKAIVKELKDSYIKPNGIALTIDEHSPTRHQGTKGERLKAILQPRYENRQVWHYHGGDCQTLEEELTKDNSAHDDCKDAVANAVEIAIPPRGGQVHKKHNVIQFNSRFGGIQH
jgi:phage terminase large subunit-like protein